MGTGRRGFLASSALIATAIAIDPWGFLTKPVSAYDSVCGSGAECSDGWTVFCCTINNGGNRCPPNSFVAGWWKADNSGFCCGSARYYIDCNAFADSDAWHCHCNDTTCDRRRVACNQFRYGQCNQQIGPYGPVVCRVVTCTPPWQWDPSCTTTSATDNRTATHSAPCLPGTCPSDIEKYYFSLGGPAGRLGPAVTPEREATGGRYRRYEHGMIGWTSSNGPHAIWGPVDAKFRSLGGAAGVGYPTTDVGTTGEGNGRYARFQRGTIYWARSTGAHLVKSPILAKYEAMGGTRSRLRYPGEDTRRVSDGHGWITEFQGGVLLWSSSAGTHYVSGPILAKYWQMGGPTGKLGYPTADNRVVSDRRGTITKFQHGILLWMKSTGAHYVSGPILDRYWKLGGPTGPLGYPISDNRVVSDRRGTITKFQHGIMLWKASTGARHVAGPILEHYWGLRGPTGSLGYPRSDEYSAYGGRRQDFEHGKLHLDPTTGKVKVIR